MLCRDGCPTPDPWIWRRSPEGIRRKKIGTGPNSTRPGVTGGRCPGQYWDPGLAGYGLWRNELAPCTLETLGLFGTMPNGWSREWVYSGDAEEYRLAGVEDSNC